MSTASPVRERYTCPCCGYRTLDEPPGSFDICHVCYWEDDAVPSWDPDRRGGANTFSLRECQQNFRAIGACDLRCREFVQGIQDSDEKDPDWRPLPPRPALS